MKIEQVTSITRAPQEPHYSTHGYLITQDGTIYTLLRKWWHGAVLALLYPSEAAAAGYTLPDDPNDLNVFEFQRFELDNHDRFPVIRICPGRMMGPMSVDRGCGIATPEQVEAVRLVIKVLGMSASDTVAADSRDMPVRKMIDFLTESREIIVDEGFGLDVPEGL